MVSLVAKNRFKLKKHFNKILRLIAVNDLDELMLAVDVIEGDIFKYCMSRSLDFVGFQKALRGIRHSITHFRTPWRRTQRLYEQSRELHDLFSQYEKSMSLKEKLKIISEDLTYDLSKIFESEDEFDPSQVFDDFDDIAELGPEIKKYGYDVYQLYRQLIRNIGAAKPHIPVKISGADRPRPADIKLLKQVTGIIFSFLDDIIATFDQPPAPKKADEKKKDKKNYELDLDEVKRSALTSQALHYIFRENWTPLSTARHLNMTIEDLFELLDIEFESEDEKKDIPETDDTKKDKSIENDEE